MAFSVGTDPAALLTTLPADIGARRATPLVATMDFAGLLAGASVGGVAEPAVIQAPAVAAPPSPTATRAPTVLTAWPWDMLAAAAEEAGALAGQLQVAATAIPDEITAPTIPEGDPDQLEKPLPVVPDVSPVSLISPVPFLAVPPVMLAAGTPVDMPKAQEVAAFIQDAGFWAERVSTPLPWVPPAAVSADPRPLPAQEAVAAELPDAELKSAKIIPDSESSTKAVPLVPVPVAAPDPSAELDIAIQSPLMLATSIDSGKVPAPGPQTALLRSTEPRRSVATSTTSVVLPSGTQPPEVSVSARVVAPDIATLAMPEQWATSDHSVLATAPAKSSGLTAALVTEAAPAIAPFAKIVPGPMALPPAAADVIMRATPSPASATSAVSFQPLPHHVAEAGQQIVLRTASAAADKVSTVSVDLRPPELGRVEVRLTFHEGKVQVSMVAERLETYEAFRQDKANIEQQMQQAGFQMGGGGLDLQHGRLPRDTQDQAPRPQSLTQTDSEEAETEATPLSRLTSDSLIDLIA